MKLNGEDVGRVEPDEKATGCGLAGEVWKGTAAGRNGEEKIGGPGGVLNWDGGVLIETPLPVSGEPTDLEECERRWSCRDL